jgi:hypothetical protein
MSDDQNRKAFETASVIPYANKFTDFSSSCGCRSTFPDSTRAISTARVVTSKSSRGLIFRRKPGIRWRLWGHPVLAKARWSGLSSALYDLPLVKQGSLEMTRIVHLVVFVRLLELFQKMNAQSQVYLVLRWFDMPHVFQAYHQLRHYEGLTKY